MVHRELLDRFKEKIAEKFDVYHAQGNKNVFDLHKREEPDESVTGLSNIFRSLHIGPGFFGLYVLTATRQFWGIRKPVLGDLQGKYADNWAVVLIRRTALCWVFLQRRRYKELTFWLVYQLLWRRSEDFKP